MRNSQLIVGLVFAAALGFGLGSCGGSSSSANADGSSSSGSGLACPSGGSGSCTQAELNTYDNCVLGQCGSAIATCYGSGYQNGSFSGVCATYGTCASKCSCGDSACMTACGEPSSGCLTCLESVGTCVLSSTCTRPACLTSGVGGASGGGLGGFTGGGLGGSTGGGLGGITGTGGGTCADLLTCCNSIASATVKAQCMTEYNLLLPMGDAICGAAVSGLRSGAVCP